jgi:hypothetical protein
MATPPKDPWMYHITHINNLAGIIQEGGLWSDAHRISKNLSSTNIGHLHIKQRRLSRPVQTQAGGMLGEYVPFNFCPRSVMLFAIHKGHQDYQGGQEEVIHLLSRVSLAVGLGKPWAFTDRHAELAHALHFDDLSQLDEVPWEIMEQTYWQDAKEERQAEFLVRDFFPWSAIVGIGVMNPTVEQRTKAALAQAAHQPRVVVRSHWYY